MAENTFRKRMDFIKTLLTEGKKADFISAKIIEKFSVTPKEASRLIGIAKKEMDQEEVARQAISDHLAQGGRFDHRPARFAELIFLGPAHPACPKGAVIAAVKWQFRRWERTNKNVGSRDFRRRVNLVKDAIGASEFPEQMLRTRFPKDNPLLRSKVVWLAERELRRDAENARRASTTVVEVAANKKPAGDRRQKKAAKKAAKKNKLRATQVRAAEILGGVFGLN